MTRQPRLLGIVNITADSFSDGGRFLDARAAVAQAERLLDHGADAIDLGPASSHPDAAPVSASEEMRRLEPVIDALQARGAAISVDSFLPETQRFAIARDVDYLNDIHGFPHASLYPDLARAHCQLIVMHAVQAQGIATREALPAAEVWGRVLDFFERRIGALVRAGIARERLILDPGMGFFLSSRPEASFLVLRRLDELKHTFDLPVLVSVSRKSFLRAVAGSGVTDLGPATLAAELHAAATGVDYIRSHDVRALRDALNVQAAINQTETRKGETAPSDIAVSSASGTRPRERDEGTL